MNFYKESEKCLGQDSNLRPLAKKANALSAKPLSYPEQFQRG